MKKVLPILFCLIFAGSLSAQKKANPTTKPLDEKKVQLKSIANGYLTPLPPEKAAEFEKEEAEEKARKEAAKNKDQKKSKKSLKKARKRKRKAKIRQQAKTKPQ